MNTIFQRDKIPMKILTIIPAYNEEKTIKEVVEGVRNYTDVLVVDDGSSDQTSLWADEAGANIIKHDKNRGKGAAIKTGLKYGLKNDYDLMVLLDADGQHDPQSIPLLVSEMDSADMIIGSRFLGNPPSDMPIQRRLSNGITTRLMRFVTGYHLTDSQCGFRVISNNAAHFFLDINYNDYVYESEVLFQASLNNLKVFEMPIGCEYGDEKSYVKTRHVIHYIFFAMQLLLRKIIRRI